jgi:tetratricopeptide (TPR) repeat protein
MVPMIGLVQVGSQSRADRYAYLPFVGLYLMVAWGIAEAGEKWAGARPAFRLIAGAALLGLGILTFRQVAYWRNPETLWNRALETTRGNFFAHDSLAAYLIQTGRMPEACQHFQSSLRIFPGDVPAQEGLGVCYQAQGQPNQAVRQYENVLRLSIDNTVRATAFANLGSIYRQLGDYAQAKQNYQSALQLNPDLPIALVGTGLLAQKGWDFPKAAEQYAHAMSVEPTSVGYLLLGRALEKCGRSREAQSAYAEARRLTANLRADQKTADDLLAD